MTADPGAQPASTLYPAPTSEHHFPRDEDEQHHLGDLVAVDEAWEQLRLILQARQRTQAGSNQLLAIL
jgi:hypothetical protein